MHARKETPGPEQVVGGVGGAIVNPPTTACGESVFEIVELEAAGSCLALTPGKAFTARADPADWVRPGSGKGLKIV